MSGPDGRKKAERMVMSEMRLDLNPLEALCLVTDRQDAFGVKE